MKQSDFFDNGGGHGVVAKPTKGGWLLTSEVGTLETARGGDRVFHQLTTAAKVCFDNGVNDFKVVNTGDSNE